MVRPNLLLVVLDDLAARDLTAARAPEYADLCAAGRQMTRAVSMPVCSQSRACLFYGKYGRTLGITEAMSAEDGPEPPTAAPTLASLLKDRGYSTALVGKWHLGRDPFTLNGCLGAPQARGFDHWFAGTADNLDSFNSWERIDDGAVSTTSAYPTIAQMAAAKSWWNSAAYPKFLMVALNDPHGPMQEPPVELLGGYSPDVQLPLSRRRYEKKVRACDWALGELRTFLGISNTTLVCVVSDNGTPENAAGPGQNPDRLKTTTYEDGIRVAMAWYGPGAVTHATDDRLVHLVDVPSTLVSAAGGTIPSDWDGVNLLPALGGATWAIRDHAISEATLADGTLERAVVTQTHKLRRTGLLNAELYDLSIDPTELVNLIDDPPLAAVQAELEAILYAAD